MEPVDWMELGANPDYGDNIFFKRNYIKQREDGKYWLDQEELKRYLDKEANYRKVLFSIVFIVFAATAILFVMIILSSLSSFLILKG